MRVNVKNGKLIDEPKSLDYACQRRRQLLREIARIEAHMSEPERVNRFQAKEAYDVWRVSAGRARELLKEELYVLTEWIVNRATDGEALFREAYEIFKQLEEESFDFDEEEIAFLTRLDVYFGKEHKSRQLTMEFPKGGTES